MYPETDYEISAPALYAARIILKNFAMQTVPGGRVLATEKNLAIMIDVCTGIFRVQGALDHMAQTVPWMDKDALSHNMDEMREALRMLDMVRGRLPRFGNGDRRAPAKTKEHIEAEITKQQRQHLTKVAAALSQARSPTEEQRILRAAGIIRAAPRT